jgi:hypothetical protein
MWNLESISGMPSCAAARPAARNVLWASVRTMRRPFRNTTAGRDCLAGPEAGLVPCLFAMGEGVLALYDKTVPGSFRHNPAYPPLRFIHASAARHAGKTSSTQAQNLAEWFISRRCMSSWQMM